MRQVKSRVFGCLSHSGSGPVPWGAAGGGFHAGPKAFVLINDGTAYCQKPKGDPQVSSRRGVYRLRTGLWLEPEQIRHASVL